MNGHSHPRRLASEVSRVVQGPAAGPAYHDHTLAGRRPARRPTFRLEASMSSVHIARIARSTLRFAVVSAALAFTTGCMMFMRPPKDLDYSRTRMSEGGAYRATIQPQGDTIPQGKLHRWTLHLETAAGVPVQGATIAVDGGMPRHGHGLPTKPRVTRPLGAGDYAVEGMKFNMGGWWVVKFRVAADGLQDSVVFNLKL